MYDCFSIVTRIDFSHLLVYIVQRRYRRHGYKTKLKGLRGFIFLRNSEPSIFIVLYLTKNKAKRNMRSNMFLTISQNKRFIALLRKWKITQMIY